MTQDCWPSRSAVRLCLIHSEQEDRVGRPKEFSSLHSPNGPKQVIEKDSGVALDHPFPVLEHHHEVTLKMQKECEMGKYQDLRQYSPHFRIPVNLLEKQHGPENSHNGFSMKSPITLSPS